MNNSTNKDIVKTIGQLIDKGEKVHSNVTGRVGIIYRVDGPKVFIKLINGKNGVTGFPEEVPIKLEKNKDEEWTIGDKKDDELNIGSLSESRIKSIIRKIVLKEMTQADYGVGKTYSNDELTKDVKKAIGSAGEAVENPLNNKVTVDDKKNGTSYQCEVTECGKGLYDVTVIKNGSDRKVGKQLSTEKLAEFLKDSVKDEDSYTDKALKKGNPNKVDEKKKKDGKVTDKMEEVDEVTQKELSDKKDVKAEENVNKKLSPQVSDLSDQMGGEVVDKIEKVIDRVLKNRVKADGKTPLLKADPDKESSDKLKIKQKDTPELKPSKK